jgi:hypothetical protein
MGVPEVRPIERFGPCSSVKSSCTERPCFSLALQCRQAYTSNYFFHYGLLFSDSCKPCFFHVKRRGGTHLSSNRAFDWKMAAAANAEPGQSWPAQHHFTVYFLLEARGLSGTSGVVIL